MIKTLLISGLLSVCVGSALAQAPSSNLKSETFKQRLRAQYLNNDTAQAIINLYGRRQAGGASWIFSSALVGARAATASNSTTVNNAYVVQDNSSNGAAAALVLVPFAAYGLGKMLHYSNGNLEKTLTAYASGQPLARSTRRKLKRRFFNQPIIQYKSVDYKPAK
ncbi:hypothetical protein [Hymenobacter crusticola]|uniref:Uncharacterized protein n=1 Tax=Hymenobacter crusticola TaxID=1770526 RepID=A0A243WDT5_9BACT|nr:hypothetical protein [Hymenobacter crusticola]OUJ73815.1 hypothetical protein BXP70_12625 [Hymenobacter crusticola]